MISVSSYPIFSTLPAISRTSTHLPTVTFSSLCRISQATKLGITSFRPTIKVTDNEVLAVIYNRGKLQGNLECKRGQDKIVIDKYWYPVFQKGYEAGCRQVIQGEVQPGAAMIERKYWPPGYR